MDRPILDLDYEVHPIFLGSANYRNQSFIGPAGLGVNLLNVKGLNIGPVISFQGGRSNDPIRVYLGLAIFHLAF